MEEEREAKHSEELSKQCVTDKERKGWVHREDATTSCISCAHFLLSCCTDTANDIMKHELIVSLECLINVNEPHCATKNKSFSQGVCVCELLNVHIFLSLSVTVILPL